MILTLLAVPMGAGAQLRVSVDTLECPIVGFSAGLMGPLGGSASGGLKGATMADLYDPPYLDFALEAAYKWKSNWLLTLDGDFWFGLNSDNLLQRQERMGDVFTSHGYAMTWGGYDGVVTMYNRGLSVRAGVGRIVPVFKGNPNSGLLLRVNGGWMNQMTRFVQEPTQTPVPSLQPPYTRLYDHLRNGVIVTESVGLIYMSNQSTYVNVKLELTLSECFTWPSRPYTIDKVMGLAGRDENTYFDLLWGLRLSWMFPITGKRGYDYYF